jgi:hypothetical protein
MMLAVLDPRDSVKWADMTIGNFGQTSNIILTRRFGVQRSRRRRRRGDANTMHRQLRHT